MARKIEVANSVLRERFGIDAKNMAIVSGIIKATLDAELIKLADENAALKNRRYRLLCDEEAANSIHGSVLRHQLQQMPPVADFPPKVMFG